MDPWGWLLGNALHQRLYSGFLPKGEWRTLLQTYSLAWVYLTVPSQQNEGPWRFNESILELLVTDLCIQDQVVPTTEHTH